jgi:hypothetical protein
VLRRRRALNPSIRRPSWLDARQVASLSTLCLLGAWSANNSADRRIVAELAKRDYEDVEQDLRHLALLDDAPILEIGEVWRAKSPLELLDLFGERVTRDEIDRFFQIARRVLATPDPMLELPDNERYAAQIHGKVRSESGLLIRSICDTLVKLSVRGPQIPSLAAASIEARVSTFVRDLLLKADGIRWLPAIPRGGARDRHGRRARDAVDAAAFGRARESQGGFWPNSTCRMISAKTSASERST